MAVDDVKVQLSSLGDDLTDSRGVTVAVALFTAEENEIRFGLSRSVFESSITTRASSGSSVSTSSFGLSCFGCWSSAAVAAAFVSMITASEAGGSSPFLFVV